MAWLLEQLIELFQGLMEILKGWAEWFINAIYDVGREVLDQIIAALPGGWQQDASTLVGYLEIVNEWVPLDYCLLLFTLYYTFLGVFVTVKFILKLIPTIG